MNSPELTDTEKITEEAVFWVAKLHQNNVSHKDKVAFSRWLNTSHRHEQVFDDISSTWASLGNAWHLPEIQQQVEDLPAAKKPTRNSVLYSLQLACLALFMLGGFIYYGSFQSGSVGQQSAPAAAAVARWSYSTAAGEDRMVYLPDGSSIHLNTRTTLTAQYTAGKRLIMLHKGEAHFQVASDAARPFVVEMGATSVTAVGTAFNILRKGRQSTVTITEGIVDVQAAHDESLRVEANRRVELVENRLEAVQQTTGIDEIAWQKKQLIFRSQSLEQVFSELNRYLEQPVLLQGQALKNLRLTGTFDVSDPQAIVEALIESYELDELYQEGNRVIRQRIL